MNVPELRFPEFECEWEEKKLGNLSDKISDGIHSTPKYQEETEYYFINGNNLINKRIVVNDTTKTVSKEEFLKYQKELTDKTILISINGTIGNLAYYNNEKVILGKSAAYINLKSEANKEFIYNLLQTYPIFKYFTGELKGSTIKNLSLATLKATPIFLPNISEQEKIASFLSKVDEKIEKLEKKEELWRTYKEGMKQQLFSQSLRFKDDNGNDYPDWKEKKLSDVSVINPKSDDLPDEFIYIDLESVKSGILKKENYIAKEVAPSRAQRVLKEEDILYQTVRPYQRNNLYFKPQNSEKYVASTGYAQIRCKENSQFVFQYLHADRFVNKVLSRCTGTSYPAISSTDLGKIKIIIPILQEQTKIANFLTAIDTKIENIQKELMINKEFKKGLLQQMFPSDKKSDEIKAKDLSKLHDKQEEQAVLL